MKWRQLLKILGFSLLLIYVWLKFDAYNYHDSFSEKAKIAVREIGNQNLLVNLDSSSLVMPVIQLEEKLFQLSFQKELALNPDSLPQIIERTLSRAKLTPVYRLEVLQCEDGEVAYSYEVSSNEKNTIIPCRGRILPVACYQIQMRFHEVEEASDPSFLLIIALILSLILFFFKEKDQVESTMEKTNSKAIDYTYIGSYQFYPSQHKLIKTATEISLSNKECELLEILAASPNQIVKREELIKRIWEDNGVVVGRSLDTYVSKLRKKLKDDDSIKLTNVHGVGYKLEIS